MNRHIRLGVGLLATSVLLLTACGGSDSEEAAAPSSPAASSAASEPAASEAAPADPNAVPGNGEEIVIGVDEPRQAAVDAFLAAYPDAPIRSEIIDRSKYADQILLNNQAGEPNVDVIFAESEIQVKLADSQRNYNLALDGLVSQEVLDGFFPGANAECVFNGELKCLRNDLAQNVLFYDAAKMTELGYTVPTTWEEYLALGLQVAEEQPNLMVGAFGDFQAANAYYWPSQCPMSTLTGATDVTIDVAKTPECSRVTDMADQLIAAGSLPVLGPFSEEFIARVKDGDFLMAPLANWYGPFVFGTKEDSTYRMEPGTLGVAPPLRWEAEETNWTGAQGGGSWAVWQGTKNPELAVAFAVFASTNVDLLAANPGFPGTMAGAEAWAASVRSGDVYASGDDAFAAFNEAAGVISPSLSPVAYSVQTAFQDTVVNGLLAGGTVAESIPAWQENLANLAQAAGYSVTAGS